MTNSTEVKLPERGWLDESFVENWDFIKPNAWSCQNLVLGIKYIGTEEWELVWEKWTTV